MVAHGTQASAENAHLQVCVLRDQAPVPAPHVLGLALHLFQLRDQPVAVRDQPVPLRQRLGQLVG